MNSYVYNWLKFSWKAYGILSIQQCMLYALGLTIHNYVKTKPALYQNTQLKSAKARKLIV